MDDSVNVYDWWTSFDYDVFNQNEIIFRSEDACKNDMLPCDRKYMIPAHAFFICWEIVDKHKRQGVETSVAKPS